MAVSKLWPSNLPYEPLRDSFDMRQRFAPNLTHETEQGPGRQRPNASAVWAKLSYKIVMTETQAAQADSFLLNDLRQASMRFQMKVGRFYAPAADWPLKVCMIENGAYTIEVFADQLALVIPSLMVLDY